MHSKNETIENRRMKRVLYDVLCGIFISRNNVNFSLVTLRLSKTCVFVNLQTWEIVEEVWRIREEKGYVPSLDDDDEMFDKRPVVPTTASNPLASDILEEQL